MKFNEISEAYNSNIKNIDEARNVFEEEVRSFIKTVCIHTERESKRLNQDADMKKIRWIDESEVNGGKYGAPLSFYSEVSIPLSLKPNGKSNFKNKAAYILFQVSFDDSLGEFSFKGVFRNTNGADEYLDEKFAEILETEREKLPEAFSRSKLHRTREFVAFSAPLTNELWKDFGPLVTEFFRICDRAISAQLVSSKADPEAAAEVA